MINPTVAQVTPPTQAGLHPIEALRASYSSEIDRCKAELHRNDLTADQAIALFLELRRAYRLYRAITPSVQQELAL